MQQAAEIGLGSFLPRATSATWGGRVTRAEVNLDAIARNVRSLRAAAPGAKLMAVVKGNAYGHGAVAVAKAALASGASWLAVYTVEEACVLRRAAITAPILVFGPFQAAEATDIWNEQLTPTISTLDAAAELQRHAGDRTLPFHLKIDTGLTRAGIAPGDAVRFMQGMRAFPSLQAQGLYTHFASADEPSKELSAQQLQTFVDVGNALTATGFSFPLKHMANSAATLDFPASHFDMVRAGISLYGYYPSRHVSTDAPLHPALSLISAITRLQRVLEGTGVGYGHEFRCARASAIALVPVGYGDGWPRRLANGRGTVLVRGVAAPICGRVSMDQLTLDVTDVAGVRTGDEVVLIGCQDGVQQTADDVAIQADTISYEILTGLMPRVPRVYVENGYVTGALRM